MGKFEELSPRARELFERGYTQKDIAKILDVSETTLVEWKKKYEGTSFDWKDRKQKVTQEKKSVKAWLEEQIQQAMLDIEKDKSNEESLNRLSKFIVMNKNYDGSIDKLGETSRVMGAFASFVRENFPNDVEIIKEITNSFMRYMGR
ncbi:MAG: DUF1804 family protein [Brevinema sp.]